MPEENTDQKQRLEIDWLKTAAGALAAVSSAVVLSTVGVAGTLIGAAVGSVVFTLSSSLYSAGLDRSRRRVSHAQTLAAQRLGVAQAEVRRAARRRTSQTAVEGHLEHADQQLVEARLELDALTEQAEEETSPPWRERLAELPWKRIALVTVALFVVAVVAITAFELIAGRPVSSFTGGSSKHSGTSFTDMGGGGGADRGRPPAPAPTAPGRQPTGGAGTPTQVPTFQTTPTQVASPTSSPSASTPTPTPTPTPSSTPTTLPASPTPTPQQTPATTGAG